LSSHRVEHNCENRILNRYHISEINYFKVLLLCEMKWKMMLDGCLYGMTSLDTDIDTLHAKKMV
jgi:hypothetical protein